MKNDFHIPVLLNSAVEFLTNPESEDENSDVNKEKVIIDCTTGGGGYSLEICKKLNPALKLICFDKDLAALRFAENVLKDYAAQIIFINGNFGNLDEYLTDLGINKFDGIVFDLGLSSFQIENEAGFSFMKDTELDMRAYKKDELTAKDVLNDYDEKDLTRVFFEYGEIANAERLSELIVKSRIRKTINSTYDLLDVINSGYSLREKDKFDFYAKIFQSLRIEVNNELQNLKSVLYTTELRLNRGGRMVSVAYHSLEDRIVKNFLRERRNVSFKILTGKSVKPDYKEIKSNRRARSARLRAAERL